MKKTTKQITLEMIRIESRISEIQDILKSMKIYKTVTGVKFTENITYLGNLRDLEIFVKEVKTRKVYICSICHRIITIGETALKTAQKYHGKNEYYFQNFCDGCYLKSF